MVLFALNGRLILLHADPTLPLLPILQQRLSTAEIGRRCDIKPCEDCTVYLDGVQIRACEISLAQADGRAVDTRIHRPANN